jgi:hypothetical protein
VYGLRGRKSTRSRISAALSSSRRRRSAACGTLATCLECKSCTGARPRSICRAYGDYAASMLKPTQSAKSGVGCISWRAMSPVSLERRASAIEAEGLGIGWSKGDFGRGRSYRFHDPDRHLMDICYEKQKYVASLQLHSSYIPAATPQHRRPARQPCPKSVAAREQSPGTTDAARCAR